MAKNASLPVSGHSDQHVTRTIRDRAGFASLAIKTGLLTTRAATVFAFLMVGDPFALFMNARALLVVMWSALNGSTQFMPITKPTAKVHDLSPTEKKVPRGQEIARAERTQDQKQDESPQPTTDAFLQQLNAWARKEDEAF